MAVPDVNARGWPFHAETDSVAEWAATSEQLAGKLASEVPGGLAGMRVEARSVQVTATAGGWATITFAKPFASAPVVVAVPGGSAGIPSTAAQYVGSVAATHFDYGGLTASASVKVNYIAIGVQA